MLFVSLYYKAVILKKVFEAEIVIFTVQDYTPDDVILDNIVVIFLLN
jgi:hypothetical protein